MSELLLHVLTLVRRVEVALGMEPSAEVDSRLGDVFDSMGLVELIGHLADDCATEPADIEDAVGRRFGTIRELAAALQTAGFSPTAPRESGRTQMRGFRPSQPAYLAAVRACLPAMKQSDTEIDALLGRPPGWFASRTGIVSRRLWGEQDPLTCAADVARQALHDAGVRIERVAALFVTSEAPPRMPGLAARIHALLELPRDRPAFEIGGACAGLLHAMRLGASLLTEEAVLIVSVEAASRWLRLHPGPTGETAALFGDAAAACVLTSCFVPGALLIREITLAVDGSRADLLMAQLAGSIVELHMNGLAMAGQAGRALVSAIREIAEQHQLSPAQLQAIMVHGGNGRLPGLLARLLSLSPEAIHSTTAHTGNLGSASLAVAHVLASEACKPPMVWASVGAGMHFGAMLLGSPLAGP